VKILKLLLFWGVGLIIIILSIYGFSLLLNRPALPSETNIKEVVRIDEIDIKQPRDITFALARKAPGETVRVFLEKPDGKTEKVEVRLVRYYAGRLYPLVYLIVGLLSFVLGIAVQLLGPGDIRSRLFYWLALCFGASVIIDGELYCLKASPLSLAPGVLFLAAYTMVFPLILHFSLTFIRSKITREKIPVYLPALVFIILFELYFLYSLLNHSIEPFRLYMSNFFIYRTYVIIMILLSVFMLIFGYRRAHSSAEKIRIAWILYGLFLGVMPFLAFYQLPEIFRMKPLLSEDSSAIFFIFVPLALAIAILKYKLFDIRLIIKRSLAYSILSILIISIYFFIVQTLTFLFARFIPIQKTVLSLIGILVAAAVFHPGREKIQQLVDKTFFRTSYDFKKRIFEFTRQAGERHSCEELVNLLFETVKNSLLVEKINVSIIPANVNDGFGFSWLREIQRGDSPGELIPLLAKEPAESCLFAERKSIQIEEGVDFSKEQILARLGWALILIMPLRPVGWISLLALGHKKSGSSFSAEDIEFLQLLSDAFHQNLKRIKLQAEVIYERASKEKLDELSRLKTEFISTVSHELRTPLSSLQGLAEILHSGKVKDNKKKAEMLGMMEEESRRLSQLLHNILDFGQIEQKTKAYHFRPTPLQPLLEDVCRIFSYRLKAEGFVFKLEQPDKPVYLEADPDSLKQALINLIDNAIKYSKEIKEIVVILKEGKSEIRIQVKDRGLGVPVSEQEKIFESFYRSPEAAKNSPQGVGLGLKIVKHIMGVHRGRVEVESQVGTGSTFSLVFPRP
jgi:signal transduction histidine kinase